MADIVLDMRDRRPLWAIPEWAVEEIRAAVPAEWSIHVAATASDGSGDGGGVAVSPEVLAAVRGARVYLGHGVAPEVWEEGAATLEWIHSGSAGVGGTLRGALRDAVAEGRLIFTNSAGVYGPPIAETVLAMLLHFCRGLDHAVAAQHRGAWESASFYRADAPVRELSRMTVGILGYGGIGREVGRRLRALGAEVVALRRSSSGDAPSRDGSVDEDGVRVLRIGDPGALDEVVAGVDAVVVTVPDTPETRGIIDASLIARMRPDAVIVNVARGRIIDEGALVDALKGGRLRGAGLDVFRTEPLPADSPLWKLENVLITPHVSGVSHDFWRRQTELIVSNLGRFAAGERLRNEVDAARGY